jgi:prepilin-type N-terminal cleavage/methylation domain-containing protein
MTATGHREAGFTLLELVVVLGVLSILGGAVTPLVVSHVRARAAQTTAEDLAALADAARAFYVARYPATRWPTAFAELEAAGYLPSGFRAQNPFGQAYTMTTTAGRLQLATQVPSEVAPAVARLLPLSTAAGGQVTTTYPVPGQSSDLAAIQLQIDQLRADLAALRSDVTALQRSVSTLNTRMGAVEGRVGSLETRMASAETRLQTTETRLSQADFSGRLVMTDGRYGWAGCPWGWAFVDTGTRLLLGWGATGSAGGHWDGGQHQHYVSVGDWNYVRAQGSTGPPTGVMRAGQQGRDFLTTDWHGHDYDSRTWNWISTQGWSDASTNPWIVPPYYTVTLCRRW